MTTLAIDLATIGLIFMAWFALAFGLAVVLGRFIAQGNREEEAERLEVDGPFADLTAEREKRANRALLAQRERWGRSA